jgi:cyclic dehypoxanthinyl futalosine synthase
MMYGHIETPEDIVEHLEALRQSQDRHPGFSSFIPWSYKRENTALRRLAKHWAGKEAYTFSRLYLDNFAHIASSWFSESKEIGIESLRYGADDFGGTILEENVHRATNFINKTDHNGILSMIRQAGFEPAERDSFYNIIRTYENVQAVEVSEEGRIKEEDVLPIFHSS